MTVTPPPASPERPDLATVETKPDVLVRLRAAIPFPAGLTEVIPITPAPRPRIISAVDLADAIVTIQALREANQRHCDDERMLKEARARVAELEAALRKIVAREADYEAPSVDLHIIIGELHDMASAALPAEVAGD